MNILWILTVALTACGDEGGGASGTANNVTGFTVLSQPKAIAPLPSAEIWRKPQSDALLERGRLVWTGTCITCHSTGLGGAPLIGNAEQWGPRIEQGLDVLVSHAKAGFYGDAGEMPPRGGNPALSDEEIAAAVRFMASRAGPVD